MKIKERKLFGYINFAILMLIIGFFQFASFNFSWEIYLTFGFWYVIFYRIIIKVLCDKIGNDLMFDYHYNSDVMNSAREEYNKLNVLRKRDFETYIDTVYNIDIKKKTYEKMLLIKRNKFEKKIKKTNNQKKIAKYNKIIKELDNEYDINKINIKYYKTKINDFYDIDGCDNADSFKTRPEYNKAVANYSRKNISTYLLITIITGSIIYQFQNPTDIDFWINLLINIAIVIQTLAMAIFKSKGLFNGEYLATLKKKVDILKNYIEWSTDETVMEELLKKEREKFNSKISQMQEKLGIE